MPIGGVIENEYSHEEGYLWRRISDGHLIITKEKNPDKNSYYMDDVIEPGVEPNFSDVYTVSSANRFTRNVSQSGTTTVQYNKSVGNWIKIEVIGNVGPVLENYNIVSYSDDFVANSEGAKYIFSGPALTDATEMIIGEQYGPEGDKLTFDGRWAYSTYDGEYLIVPVSSASDNYYYVEFQDGSYVVRYFSEK